MMWQEIAVAAAGLAALAYIAAAVVRKIKNRNNPCCGCGHSATCRSEHSKCEEDKRLRK